MDALLEQTIMPAKFCRGFSRGWHCGCGEFRIKTIGSPQKSGESPKHCCENMSKSCLDIYAFSACALYASWIFHITKPPKTWNLISTKQDETKGFLYLGHPNWTIFSLCSWFCPKIFPPFYHSYWEVRFLITPKKGREEWAGAENGEKGFTQNYMTNRGFCTWGIQTGLFAASWADFVS